ncbi:MAG: metallophosphoesterase [Deltaproteobacteria bacterium]|jgi:predicted MPP superfamily phosphohydrolase|nr:metallophosphoesterase [Deltaproteobacteria bacterium]
MMFIYFGILLTAGAAGGFIFQLPLSWPLRLLLSLLTFLSASRVAILRSIYGGIGGIEAPKTVLLVTSFFQGIVVLLFLLAMIRLLVCGLSLAGSFLPASGGRFFSLIKKSLFQPRTSLIILAAAVLLSGYSLYEAARVPRVRQTQASLAAWPAALDGLRVAILADMHISRFFDRPWVEAAVALTMAEKPDLILLPGDMIDGTVAQRAEDVAPLAGLSAPLGVLAIVGNHEYYSDVLAWLPAFEKLGLKVLYNSHTVIFPRGVPVVVSGLTDLTALDSRFNLPGPDLELALKGAPQDAPVILMDHRPVRARENAAGRRIAWQISGHTHGGMLPILKSIVAKINAGFVAGWYETGGMKLYVHRGLGLWNGFPMRLMDPSDITIVTLRSPEPA